MKNVIWFANINKIGGVESVIWNVIRKYKDREIVIWYDTADMYQIKRFSQYVSLIKFNPNQIIECDNLIVNYNYDRIEGHYKAKRVIYMVHANYKYLLDNNVSGANVVKDPKFEYYAVSKWAADNYYLVSGIQPEVCYNPITIDDNRDAILIVSATRISVDKGKMVDRMEKLANRLDERGMPFIWLVFTNSKNKLNNPNIVNVPSRLDILPFLKKADFVAQLSDSEAFCMTALESVTIGTPLLLTEIESFKEMQLNDTNAIYFKMDMSNIDEAIDKMSNKFKFKYTPNEDIWGDLLAKGKSKEKIETTKIVKVKATKYSNDKGIEIAELGRIAKPNEEFEIIEERLDVLMGNNPYKAKFIELI